MLHAQNGTLDAQFYAQKSENLQKNGMILLGSWATLNIFSGSVGYVLSENDTRYFHQMNAGWNVVNLAIAGFALHNLSRSEVAGYTYTESLKKLQNLDNILVLNAGLDVAYMAAGTWLWERGLRKNSSRLRGYGKSLLLQGGFLFAFDLVLYFLHRPLTHRLTNLASNVELTSTGLRIRF